MNSLWSDGWFYVSAAGFLTSTVLFVFLLRQYRAAVEAEESEDPAPEVKPIALKPANAREAGSVSAGLRKGVAEGPANAREAGGVSAGLRKGAAEGPANAREAGSVSEIKTQIDRLDKEMGLLKEILLKQSSQSEAILRRLNEIDEKKLLPPEPVPAPSAEPERAPSRAEASAPQEQEPRIVELKIDPSPEPQVEQEIPSLKKEDAATEPAADAREAGSVSAGLRKGVAEGPADAREAGSVSAGLGNDAVAQPTPKVFEEVEEDKPARKGPVWPI